MRLFTAIDVPEAWRDEASEMRRRLADPFDADLRFVPRDQLHVTVRFLGEVAADQAEALARAVESLPPLVVDVELESAGTFGPPSRSTVVWLGIGVDSTAADELLAELDGAVAAAGLAPSEASWRPHLTLARVRRQTGAERRRELAQAVRDLPAPGPNRFTVRSVSLYRSDLGNSAPRHKLLARSAIG